MSMALTELLSQRDCCSGLRTRSRVGHVGQIRLRASPATDGAVDSVYALRGTAPLRQTVLLKQDTTPPIFHDPHDAAQAAPGRARPMSRGRRCYGHFAAWPTEGSCGPAQRPSVVPVRDVPSQTPDAPPARATRATPAPYSGSRQSASWSRRLTRASTPGRRDTRASNRATSPGRPTSRFLTDILAPGSEPAVSKGPLGPLP